MSHGAQRASVSPASGTARRSRRPASWSLLGLIVAVAAVGCSQKPVASVNGEAITRDDLYNRILSFSSGTQQGAAAGMQILETMINERLVLQEAKRDGVLPTDQEINERLNLIRTQMQAQGANMEQQLQQAGLTVESIRHDMRVNLAQEKLVTKGITVTDQEVQKFYNDNKKTLFSTPAQVSLRQLTVASEKDAAEARKDLRNADFGLVALSRSIDIFKDRGGLVGPVPRQVPPGGPVAPQVVAQAFAMKKGAISEPIKVGNQWVIIKVDDITPEKTQSLDQLRDQIRQSLLGQKAQQSGQLARVQQRLAQLRQQARLDVNIEQYKNAAAFKPQTPAAVPGLPGVAPGAPMPASPPSSAPPPTGGAPPAGAAPPASPPAGR